MKFLGYRLMIVSVAMAILGVIMLVGSIKDKAELVKPRGDLATMTAADFYSGRFVEGEIEELWDCFAVTEETDTVFGISYNKKETAFYYAMPLPSSYTSSSPKFVVLSVGNGAMKNTADKMAQETDDYYVYDKEPYEWTTMKVEGKVTKLSGDYLKFFREYMGDIVGGDESNIVAYTINAGNNGSNSTTALIMAIVFTILGFGGTAFFIVRKVLSGRY